MLQCILEDNGGNALVECKRGKLFRDATISENHLGDDENELDESDTDVFDDLDSISDEYNLKEHFFHGNLLSYCRSKLDLQANFTS